jgi:hypothetical protein
VYPISPLLKLARKNERRIDEIMAECFGDDWIHDAPERGEMKVAADLASELIQIFASQDWESEALASILRHNTEDGRVFFQYRTMHRKPGKRPNGDLPTGALGGNEVDLSRKRSLPTLWLLRQSAEYDLWKNKKFWYPTVVFPESMPTQIYNASSAD